MRRSMVFKLIQTHFAVQIPKILVIRQRVFMSFYENDKNKAITGWKFKSRKRIIKIMYINLYKKNLDNSDEIKQHITTTG